jgi:MSHA biogenesis protein MshP
LKPAQGGFGAIAAIMILVILAALAAAIVTVSSASQMSSAQDVLGARVLQLARAGTEWGLYRALQQNVCSSASWPSPDDGSLNVTVDCVARDYNDGETAPGTARGIRVFTVTATACNATVCPNPAAVTSPGYVERQLVASAWCDWNGSACTGP